MNHKMIVNATDIVILLPVTSLTRNVNGVYIEYGSEFILIDHEILKSQHHYTLHAELKKLFLSQNLILVIRTEFEAEMDPLCQESRFIS